MFIRVALLTCASAFCASKALAADLPSRSVPTIMPVQPVFTWTGLYAGTLNGYGFSDNQAIRTTGNDGVAGLAVASGRRPQSINNRQEGRAGFGANIGYDHQFTPGNGLVIGAALDATLVNQEGRAAYSGPASAANSFTPEFSNFRQQLDWLGTVRGRIGYGYDRLLIYGTGGFAYGGVKYRASFLGAPGGAGVYQGEHDGVATGYVYGAGIEYALPADTMIGRYNPLIYFGLLKSAAMTLKVEYLRYDFGGRNVAVNAAFPGAAAGNFTSRFRTEGNLIRGGVTYRFGGL